jgi:hypothetical protein
VSGHEEHAAGVRQGGLPAEWGTPPGTPYSEERAAWVSSHARLQQARDIDKVEARKIADQVHRDANSAVVAAHVKTWQKVLADLLKEDQVDPSVVDGHLQAWAAVIAKLK